APVGGRGLAFEIGPAAGPGLESSAGRPVAASREGRMGLFEARPGRRRDVLATGVVGGVLTAACAGAGSTGPAGAPKPEALKAEIRFTFFHDQWRGTPPPQVPAHRCRK